MPEYMLYLGVQNWKVENSKGIRLFDIFHTCIKVIRNLNFFTVKCETIHRP